MNPNYDTIEEIQVIGVGATAEYGNYTRRAQYHHQDGHQ